MDTGTNGKADLQQVVEFAVKAHANQFRKHSGLPYICHPIGVMSQLAQWDITDVLTWKAAICHDVLEECTVKIAELQAVIGAEATEVVKELTFIPDPLVLMSNKDQKKRYMESFTHKSVHALVIKAADRALNSCDFLCSDPQYAKLYWKMASPLFAAVMGRGDEIKDTFGESVFPRLMYSRSTLNGVFQ